jgi:acetyl esterase/lipase
MRVPGSALSLLLFSALTLHAAVAPLPKPTLANVAYGTHPRQVLDFWQAESRHPTPLVFFIHGGGWVGGDKSKVTAVDQYLAAGISVVSINYRLIAHTEAAGITPPIRGPMGDAMWALQFVRGKAAEWNIDKRRIGASGISAGACTSLWLALHDDMADAKSDDPLARESTRLWCAAVIAAQTTLDPLQMMEWTPNSTYGGHAFGFVGDPKVKNSQFARFLAGRQSVLKWIAEYSPYALVTADDPPIYLYYSGAPAVGRPQKDPTHSPNFGVKLKEKLDGAGVPCELVFASARNPRHAQPHEYLINKLRAPVAK